MEDFIDQGMVASALEVGLMCRALDFHNIIFSMKVNTRGSNGSSIVLMLFSPPIRG